MDKWVRNQKKKFANLIDEYRQVISNLNKQIFRLETENNELEELYKTQQQTIDDLNTVLNFKIDKGVTIDTLQEIFPEAIFQEQSPTQHKRHLKYLEDRPENTTWKSQQK